MRHCKPTLLTANFPTPPAQRLISRAAEIVTPHTHLPKPSAALSQTVARVAGRHALVRRHAHPQPPARPHVAGVPASGGAARAGTLGALRELPGLRAAALLLPQQ